MSDKTEELAIPIPTRGADVLEVHGYLGFGRVVSNCQVEIWKLDEGRAVVLLTDMGQGTSVTNASETIITEVYEKHLKGTDKTKCLFMETYPYDNADIDQVVPTWDGDQVISVNWVHIGKKIKPEDVKDENRE